MITGQIDITGTYTLTSTTANALSYAPQGDKYTAFTGALLTQLNTPDALTLDELFRRVDQSHRGKLILSTEGIAFEPTHIYKRTTPSEPISWRTSKCTVNGLAQKETSHRLPGKNRHGGIEVRTGQNN